MVTLLEVWMKHLAHFNYKGGYPSFCSVYALKEKHHRLPELPGGFLFTMVRAGEKGTNGRGGTERI